MLVAGFLWRFSGGSCQHGGIAIPPCWSLLSFTMVNDSSDLVVWGLPQHHVASLQTILCISRYSSLPKGMKPLILTLYEKLGIDRFAIWVELAEVFDAIYEVNMRDPVLEDT
jgi:hypothetical protein